MPPWCTKKIRIFKEKRLEKQYHLDESLKEARAKKSNKSFRADIHIWWEFPLLSLDQIPFSPNCCINSPFFCQLSIISFFSLFLPFTELKSCLSFIRFSDLSCKQQFLVVLSHPPWAVSIYIPHVPFLSLMIPGSPHKPVSLIH